MLSRLQVRNYVLIDSLETDFPEGLIIITGQTGAGKSILMGALSLVMGAKAEASMVSEGADNCVVEAEFEIGEDDSEVRTLLQDNEVEWEDGHLIIRRVVNRSGRSRCFVNDSPVPVQVLQDISSRLVDIHSQHQTLLLSDKHFQLGTLDYFAGNSELREKCSSAWKELNVLKAELSQLDARISRIESEKDYNEAQFRQLEAAALKEGELEELEAEQKQLANAEEIKTGLCTAEELFTSASSSGEVLSLDAALKEAGKQLSRISRYVPSAGELSERVESCRRELDDILSDISSLNARTDVSESRLEEVEDRMSLLYGLMQKHGCTDIRELIAHRDSLSEALFDSSMLVEKRDSLKASIEAKAAELESAVIDTVEVTEAATPKRKSKIDIDVDVE